MSTKLVFIPLERFYARRDEIAGDDVGRRRLRRRGGGRRGGGGGGRGGQARRGGGAPPRQAPQRAAMQETYPEEDYEEESYPEEEYEDEGCACAPDPYDDISPPELGGRARWHPAMALGEHIQVRAREGRRAAVKELEPGLWLVAEVPDDEAVGAIALAPIILFAAKKALAKMGVNLADAARDGQLKEAVREAVLHAKERIRAKRAERKERREDRREERHDKKLRLPAPVEVGCRGRR